MLKGNGIGNVGADPEVKTFENGNRVAKFNVAFNRSFKKGDEWQNETTWLSCQCWNGKADKVMETVTKGSRVFVEGIISENKWQTQDGETRKSFVMNIDRFAVCEANGNGGSNDSGQTQKTKAQTETVPPSDDDVPF